VREAIGDPPSLGGVTTDFRGLLDGLVDHLPEITQLPAVRVGELACFQCLQDNDEELVPAITLVKGTSVCRYHALSGL
jgi:hypothetical protein